MKKVIGKNQVIITSLAILIAVAGYLNFADVDLGFRDKEASTDSSSILEDAGYDLTDETALLDENQADGGLTDNSLTDSQETDTPGEAVFTGSTGFAAQAKISREQVRSQNKADLQDIINNEEIDDMMPKEYDDMTEEDRIKSCSTKLFQRFNDINVPVVIMVTKNKKRLEKSI